LLRHQEKIEELGTVGEAAARKGNEETPAISSNREDATLGGFANQVKPRNTDCTVLNWLARVRIGRCMARIGERARLSGFIDA
jgi:hypothetical protein